ncbi:NADPH-quinone reductase [Pantoea stewartii subsp. indologenes]|uniref:NADP-dependent oxidoreductase n=1 Tax=Pantoea stewartii TaxID=66269 RepID=UPI00050E9865|nr:NADP-dependent oxidoreductase [Pantoea stewartii]KGD84841.1 NADPH-quinone reductase [Pantoea stewartii subsp. indologenes]
MTDMMKAVLLHEFGGPENLQYSESQIPVVGSNEVLVKVHAVGLNPPDWYLRAGYQALPPEWWPDPAFPLILGTDVSGVVAAVGEDVSEFTIDDEVYSMVRFPQRIMEGSGAYADYVSVPCSELAMKPQRVRHVEAAGAPMSLLTAWQFLVELGHDALNPFQSFRHMPVTLEGRTVLVNGAGGGVGHFAVQIAKWKGARVIAVASSRNEELMRELGADEFIDYTKVSAEKAVKNIDLVLDTVGGSNMERFLMCIKQGGALFLVNPLGFAGQDEAARKNITVSATQVRSNGAQLTAAGSLLDKGTIRVVIDSIYPLSMASAAHQRAALGSLQGKIVLTNF